MNQKQPNDLSIFHAAQELTDADQREVFLREACRQDSQLKAKVEALLQAAADAEAVFGEGTASPESQERTLLSRTVTEAPGDRIGRYKLLQQIGEGGCGIVYMAEQEEPVRRRVALKVIKVGMDTKSVIARFEAERQALAMMDHPNIAKVLDAGATDAGRPYFVMELVRGVKITEYCDEARLSTRDRLDLFIKVCQAIQHAHQKGIIHRDIKPSNILITVNDGVAVPKVIDFGIAKATNQQQLTDKTLFTAFEQFIGTPAYMSPEQAVLTSVDIDTRSDVYSLGVLLYEMLTGKTPFDAKELMASGIDAMRKTIREKEPQRPSTRLSTMASEQKTAVARNHGEEFTALSKLLKGDLDWIVMKCLEKDRQRRYETANGLAADLKRHLDNEPVLARPPSTAYRFQKAFRRNKLAFAAGGAVALALLIGMATSLWQARVAKNARRAAQHQAYVATMSAVQGAWEQNHVSRVRELLEETADAPERGFEWYYWQRQMHSELTALRGHTGPILAVAYSPDGQRIVTGSADKTARVWDANTGQEFFPLEGHTEPVRSVAFSRDGQQIATGSWDKTARVWDANTGRHLITLNGHKEAIYSVAFSSDGERIVTGSQDQTAKVWDANSGKELFPLGGHSNRVWAVAFSTNGQRIVTGSWDQTAKIWDAATGKELTTLTGHSGAVFSVAFSPEGQRIVTGSQDHSATVWDAATGADLLTLRGHSAAIFSVGYSRDGTRITTGSDDQTARLWDAASGAELRIFKGHGSRIGSVALSPDGQRIVTGGGAVRYSPDGQYVEPAIGDDQTAKVWDATGNREVLTLKAHDAAVSAVVFSPDGRLVLSGAYDGMVRVWDARTWQEISRIRAHKAPIGHDRGVAFFPDGQRIVTGSSDRTAKVWETATGKELFKLEGHTADVWSVATSPDGRWIATGGWDHTVRVWDAATGQQRHRFDVATQYVYSVAFSPDSRRIGSADMDGMVRLRDPDSGQELSSFRDTMKIWSLAFSRDGCRIVTGSHGLIAKVWDAASGEELLKLKGHTAHIHAAVFSPDGRRIVTASADQTAKLWDARTGKELLTFKGHTGWVFSAAFSPDGRRIVTAGGDRTIKVWEAATPEQVANWQREVSLNSER
jgi:WD40 repeat protein/serine/threonine protein kinase